MFSLTNSNTHWENALSNFQRLRGFSLEMIVSSCKLFYTLVRLLRNLFSILSLTHRNHQLQPHQILYHRQTLLSQGESPSLYLYCFNITWSWGSSYCVWNISMYLVLRSKGLLFSSENSCYFYFAFADM